MTTAATATTLLEFRTELAASSERVFSALTEGGQLARWFCDQAESVPIPGGRLTARWTRPDSSPQPFDGRWVVFQRPSSCAYEGGHSGYPDGYAGRVGFELADRVAGGGSVLITRHRLPARPDYEQVVAVYRSAWPRALTRLATYLAAEGTVEPGAATEPGGSTAAPPEGLTAAEPPAG
jgi:uncharacterized protein YndB with AHSA1/START domain